MTIMNGPAPSTPTNIPPLNLMPHSPSSPFSDATDRPTDVVSAYEPPSVGYDEAADLAAQTRPHWQPFFTALDDLGPTELTRRWRDAQHLIRENGVTYNVYGDPRGIARPWNLDPIPLLIAPAEAAHLEAGLVQRARLLELILDDLYGPQRLLREGFLPPELLFPNSGFLRPCHGIKPLGGRFLHLYAANLGRGGDGRWRVLGDRTQAPSGMGYALENRIVMTSTLPEAFKDCRVHRLALFFRAFRDTLRSISPRDKENPRIVLLTPGPYNETYFEHAYLARYLGYTLVEGGDLTVRDNRVYLKVLGGLQPVDVILRRLDDDFCDPLELRPDSFLGVPGLTHAVRSGTVAVANALGTGIVETPALMAYLPRLSRELLGEDLRLESVPTWWCGNPISLKHVLTNLTEMVIKPTFPSSRLEPIFPADLSSDQRAALRDRIASCPRDFVAQARVELSTAPVLGNGNLTPRKMVLRTFLTADRESFAIMPGGLTRVSASAETMVVSMQRGGGSKDTWILAAGPVSDFSLLPAGGRVELTRAGGKLPSRAADNLFWLGRYAERAEASTRLLRGIASRLAEGSNLENAPELSALLNTLHDDLDPMIPPMMGDAATQMTAAVFDLSHPGSLASLLRSLRRVAGTVRDLISLDMWRVLNGLSDFPYDLRETYGHEGPTPADVLALLNRTVISLAAFGGLAVESMTRSDGWRFLDMGRRIERSVHMIALLKGTMTPTHTHESPVLDALLEVADSSMTYRRRYLNMLRPEAVLDLLVFDESNPRSLATQLAMLEDDVSHLPRSTTKVGRAPESRLTLAALNAVRLAEVDDLAEVRDGARPALHDLIIRVSGLITVLSDTITHDYLSHLQTSRHLAGTDQTRRTAAESGDRL